MSVSLAIKWCEICNHHFTNKIMKIRDVWLIYPEFLIVSWYIQIFNLNPCSWKQYDLISTQSQCSKWPLERSWGNQINYTLTKIIKTPLSKWNKTISICSKYSMCNEKLGGIFWREEKLPSLLNCFSYNLTSTDPNDQDNEEDSGPWVSPCSALCQHTVWKHSHGFHTLHLCLCRGR